MVISNEEGFQMLMILGRCFQNFRAAERLYAVRFPQAQPQNHKSFERLAQRVRNEGTIQPSRKRQKEKPRDIIAPDVVAAVQMNRQVSTRELASESGVSHMSCFRILKESKMHPYHISLHQELHGDDYLKRMNWALWAEEQNTADQDFYNKVLWSDEATFKSNGNVNRHNMHYWSVENPHWMREVDNQRYWTLNTWCGIYNGKIIGPHFFDNNLNGENYNDFLNGQFLELLRAIPANEQQNMWFMQDGCPAHFHINVRTTLVAMFGEQWIGRGGPVPWPPRSPDMTVMDYWLWGHLKDRVYRTAPTTREDMKTRIRRECQQLSEEDVKRAVNNMGRRLQKCQEEEGRQFEHLL